MNNLFQSARLKLTIWYLCILMTISILFSLAIYAGVNREFVRFERFQQRVQEDRDKAFLRLPNMPRPPAIDINMIAESRIRVLSSLLFINIAIFILAGLAGYFLAGKTLEPIQEILEEQKRFITDASHELRTPLTSLRTEIEVSLLDKNLTLPLAKNIIKSNLEEVIKLQLLSDRLLELSHVEKSGTNKKFSTISLDDLINEAIQKTKNIANNKKISIKSKRSNISLEGDKELLQELFIIILDNAIKYNIPNGIIRITANHVDNKMIILFTDTGLGIDSKDVPHIFERFYRGSVSHSKQIKGYGLGLSIAKKIVNIHNGTISVKSELKKGTTFIVTLPLSSS